MPDVMRISLTGGRALNAQLVALAPRRQANAIRAALKAGARVIAAAIKRKAPVGTKPKPRGKRLKARIKVTEPRKLRGREIAAAVAKVAAPHAHLVEMGTQGRETRAGKSTGAMPANPFAGPAARSARPAAEAAVAAGIERAILRAAAAKGGRK